MFLKGDVSRSAKCGKAGVCSFFPQARAEKESSFWSANWSEVFFDRGGERGEEFEEVRIGSGGGGHVLGGGTRSPQQIPISRRRG